MHSVLQSEPVYSVTVRRRTKKHKKASAPKGSSPFSFFGAFKRLEVTSLKTFFAGF